MERILLRKFTLALQNSFTFFSIDNNHPRCDFPPLRFIGLRVILLRYLLLTFLTLPAHVDALFSIFKLQHDNLLWE